MDVDYGKAFKVVRAVRGMTQKDVAALAKANQNYLSLIESGDRRPSANMVDALAKALGIPVWALVVLGSDGVPDGVLGAAMACLQK
jgi:transcriptional regulator with XRE-family HTH domain